MIQVQEPGKCQFVKSSWFLHIKPVWHTIVYKHVWKMARIGSQFISNNINMHSSSQNLSKTTVYNCIHMNWVTTSVPQTDFNLQSCTGSLSCIMWTLTRTAHNPVKLLYCTSSNQTKFCPVSDTVACPVVNNAWDISYILVSFPVTSLINLSVLNALEK